MGGVKVPQAPRLGSGEGVSPSPLGEGSGRGLCPSPENFLVFFVENTIF